MSWKNILQTKESKIWKNTIKDIGRKLCLQNKDKFSNPVIYVQLNIWLSNFDETLQLLILTIVCIKNSKKIKFENFNLKSWIGIFKSGCIHCTTCFVKPCPTYKTLTYFHTYVCIFPLHEYKCLHLYKFPLQGFFSTLYIAFVDTLF